MATHEKVYAPTGEMFEVPSSKVSELVLNKGWTRSKPETVKADQSQDEEAPVVRPYKRKPKFSKRSPVDDEAVTDSE